MNHKFLITILAGSLLLTSCNNSQNQSANESENKANTKIEAKEKVVENKVDEKSSEKSSIEKTETLANNESFSGFYGNLNIPYNQKEMNVEDIISKYKNIFNFEKFINVKDVNIDENSDGNYKTYSISYNGNDGENVYLNTDKYGNLISYGTYFGENLEIEKSETSHSDLVNKLLNDLYGDKADDFVVEEQKQGYSIEDPNQRYIACRTVNNILVSSDRIEITIDKNLNLITSVTVETDTNYDFTDNSYFPEAKNVATVDEAYTKFKDLNKLYRAFLANYDYNNETVDYREVISTIERIVPIDAKTLEPIYNYNSDYTLDSAFKEEANSIATDVSSLSPEEQKAVDVNKAQKSLSDAEKKARELFDLDGYKLSYSNLTSVFNSDDKKVWNLSFSKDGTEDIDMSLKADSLTLESYGSYAKQNQTGEEIKDAESIVAIANEFLSEKASMNLKELTLTEESKNLSAGEVQSLTYVRKLKPDLYLISDKTNITINKNSGEVISFNKNWDYDFKSKEVVKNTTEEEAYNILKDVLNFDLQYIVVRNEDKASVKLAYKLSNGTSPWTSNIIVDDETKRVTDEFGTNFNAEEELNYDDIDDAKNPEIIKELADYGIGYYNGKLNPREVVREIDFFRLLASDYTSPQYIRNISDDDIYTMLEDAKVTNRKEKSPERELTQVDVAKYIVRYTGNDDVARLNYLFKDNYSDINSNDKDYGYLVLANEFKIIDSKDYKLEPSKKITREEALYYFYNLKQYQMHK